MDIAYFQTASENNRLRAVCPYRDGRGRNVYHCTGAPTILDVRRTALFIGTLLTSDRTRVIGVDGRVEPLIEPAIRSLCREGTLEALACSRLSKLSSETRDTGRGWYRHHHHHLHIAFNKISGAGLMPTHTDEDLSISPGRPNIARDVRDVEASGAQGHVIRGKDD
jgi:hypothetical protein